MRPILAVVVALLFAPLTSATDWSEARDGIAMSVVRIEDEHVYVSWTAAPGAVTYELYRGPSLDELSLLTQTPTLAFTDHEAPTGDTWYVVVSDVLLPSTAGVEVGPMRGKCLIMRGLTGVSIHMASCAPVGSG